MVFPVAFGASFGAEGGLDEPLTPAAAGVSDAVEPHSALRKSLHFVPWSVPACCAALYLALHSFIVSAFAGCSPPSAAAPTRVIRQKQAQRFFMNSSVRQFRISFSHQQRPGTRRLTEFSPAGRLRLIRHPTMRGELVDNIRKDT